MNADHYNAGSANKNKYNSLELVFLVMGKLVSESIVFDL